MRRFRNSSTGSITENSSPSRRASSMPGDLARKCSSFSRSCVTRSMRQPGLFQRPRRRRVQSRVSGAVASEFSCSIVAAIVVTRPLLRARASAPAGASVAQSAMRSAPAGRLESADGVASIRATCQVDDAEVVERGGASRRRARTLRARPRDLPAPHRPARGCCAPPTVRIDASAPAAGLNGFVERRPPESSRSRGC